MAASTNPEMDFPDRNDSDNPHLPQKRVPFTREEVKVLQECNSESFWYRCVPFSVAFMGASQYLVTTGYLKPNPRYGALFKNFGALLIGYIIGKFSYQAECRKKILLKLPNSKLAETIRKRQGLYDLMPEMSQLPDVGQMTDSESQDDNRSFDFDTDKTPTQTPKGLDDNFRPTLDREVELPADQKEESPINRFTSYQDLRQHNRSEYDKKMASPDSPLNQRPFPSRGTPQHGPFMESEQRPHWMGRTQRKVEESRVPGKSKNKYGDEWDE